MNRILDGAATPATERNDKRLWTWIVLFLAGSTLFRYGDLPDHYAYAYMMANQPHLLPFDHILDGSIFLKSSLFFQINAFLRIEEHELVLVGIYLVVSAFNLVVVYRILQRHVTQDRLIAIALLLVLTFIDRKINTNAWSLLFAVHPGSSSMFGNPFALLTIYFLLERRFAAAFLAMTGVFMFQVKENTILIPAALLFIAMSGRRDWWRGIFVLLPLGFLVLKSMDSFRYQLSYDDMVLLLQRNLMQEARDGNFFLHTPAANILLVTATGISMWLARYLRETPCRLVWAFAISTLIFQAANLLYIGVLWPYWPDPKIAILGMVRSSRFVLFFFFIVASAAIALRSPLRSYEKAAAILALLLLHGESWKGAVYPLVVLAGGIGVPRLAETLGIGSKTLAGRMATVSWQRWTVSVLAIYAGGQAAVGGVFNMQVNPLAYEYAGRFSIGVDIDRKAWEALSRVRVMEGGGPLIAVIDDRRRGLSLSRDVVTYARKATFNSEIFSGLAAKPDQTFYAEVDARGAIVANLLAAARAGRAVSPEILEFLRRRGTWLLVPEKVAPLLAPYGRSEKLDGYVLYRPALPETEKPPA